MQGWTLDWGSTHMEPVEKGASVPRMSSSVGTPSLAPLLALPLCCSKGPLLNMLPGLKLLGLPPAFGMLMPSCFNRSPVARKLSCIKGRWWFTSCNIFLYMTCRHIFEQFIRLALGYSCPRATHQGCCRCHLGTGDAHQQPGPQSHWCQVLWSGQRAFPRTPSGHPLRPVRIRTESITCTRLGRVVWSTGDETQQVTGVLQSHSVSVALWSFAG